MPRIETATCQDCGWRGPVEDTKEFRNLYERAHPGDVMPAGDCPVEGCGGAAMLDDSRRDADDLRPAMVALMLGLDRLHDSIGTGDPRAPLGAHLKELADYARKALAAGPQAATRLQHLRRHRRPGRCVGLLGCRRAGLGAAQHL